MASNPKQAELWARKHPSGVLPDIKLRRGVLGCRAGNTIYLHKNLIEYPKLFSEVLLHELRHTAGYGLSDIKQDLMSAVVIKKSLVGDLMRFTAHNPDSLYMFSPLMRIDKKWYFDPFSSAACCLLAIVLVWI